MATRKVFLRNCYFILYTYFTQTWLPIYINLPQYAINLIQVNHISNKKIYLVNRYLSLFENIFNFIALKKFCFETYQTWFKLTHIITCITCVDILVGDWPPIVLTIKNTLPELFTIFKTFQEAASNYSIFL